MFLSYDVCHEINFHDDHTMYEHLTTDLTNRAMFPQQLQSYQQNVNKQNKRDCQRKEENVKANPNI
jgi:hypothetical protein